jgi:hypothetical protein
MLHALTHEDYGSIARQPGVLTGARYADIRQCSRHY